jgi:acetaldehyde dehydrogenase (acetylating)
MPAFRVLVNTPAPQGSTGITTNVFPSMTLGCGAVAGNITSDNVGPQHLINIKRLAYAVRRAEDAFEVPAAAETPVTRHVIAAAVDRYLSNRGVTGSTIPKVSEQVVDRFLSSRRNPPAPPSSESCHACTASPPEKPAPAPPAIAITDFVCEDDVRAAMKQQRKIYVGPKTIVTPSARDLAERFDILVLAQR